jgi:hypothetical protein
MERHGIASADELRAILATRTAARHLGEQEAGNVAKNLFDVGIAALGWPWPVILFRVRHRVVKLIAHCREERLGLIDQLLFHLLDFWAHLFERRLPISLGLGKDGLIFLPCGLDNSIIICLGRIADLGKPGIDRGPLLLDLVEFLLMIGAHIVFGVVEFLLELLDCRIDLSAKVMVAIPLDMLDKNLSESAGVNRFQRVKLGRALTKLRLKAGRPSVRFLNRGSWELVLTALLLRQRHVFELDVEIEPDCIAKESILTAADIGMSRPAGSKSLT